jgi:hypothetical protein
MSPPKSKPKFTKEQIAYAKKRLADAKKRVEEYDKMIEQAQKEKKHPSINKSPVSFEDIHPKWSSSPSPSAKSPSMSPPMSPPKSPSMSPPMSPPKSPSMSPPKSWFDDFVFLNDEHEKLFKSFPEKKQQMMIRMAEDDHDRMHRMLHDQLAKAISKKALPNYTYKD